jgi:tetratricopeptide (TPR) repeat protein
VIDMEELRITARRTDEGDLELDSYDAEGLFVRGTERLNNRRCRDAVVLYDRVADEFPTSRYVSPSLYNAGLCLREAGEHELAAERLERLLRDVPDSPDVKHAQLELAGVLASLERWQRLTEITEASLARDDLTPDERVEALARRAQALLGLERIDEAQREARSAIAYWRAREEADAVRNNFHVAAANYVLAETIRQQGEAIAIPQAEVETQHQVLEQKAQLLLQAQREYFNVMQHRNAHWAAAAGYRIGAMYDHLWDEIMTAPTPPPRNPLPAGTEPVYEEEYRLELARLVKPLLRHSIRYWELTLMMVERTGVRTDWAERVREDLERARSRLLDQPEGPGGID